MQQRAVDLYEYYRLPKPEGAQGRLVCLAPEENLENRLRPGVLVIPGGGYAMTSWREGEPVALEFLCRGYAAFTLWYSVAPLRYPVALREAALAMRYIREHAEEFHLDPHRVAAIGFSAGGHLCASLGTLYDQPEVADLGDAALLRPDALGLCYPVLVEWGATHRGTFDNLTGGDTRLRQSLSLEKRVRPDMPPCFLWHTREDPVVPCRNSLIMAQALAEAGVDFALHIYRLGPHGLSTADEKVYPGHSLPSISPDVPQWLPAILGYFAELGLTITDPT